jgi:hypothetical protein
LPEAVEDGALDAMLGVAGEDYLLPGVVFLGCIE